MKVFSSFILVVTWLGMALNVAVAQEKPLSEQMAHASMERWSNGRFVPEGARWAWNYELGTLLEGMDGVWLNTADGAYFEYIKRSVDQFVGADGSIPTYKPEENQLDNILLGGWCLGQHRSPVHWRFMCTGPMFRDPSKGYWILSHQSPFSICCLSLSIYSFMTISPYHDVWRILLQVGLRLTLLKTPHCAVLLELPRPRAIPRLGL